MCNTVVAAFSDGRYESLSCNQSGCAAYNRVRLLLRFELYKTPKSGGAASIWRSACTRHNTVFHENSMIFKKNPQRIPKKTQAKIEKLKVSAKK